MNSIGGNLTGLSSDMVSLVDVVGKVCGLKSPEPGGYEYGINATKWPVVPDDLMQEDGGFELLGTYDPAHKRITIYVERCRQFAGKIGASSDEVTQIVMIHEVSHLVHHLGELGSEGLIWEKFPRAEAEIREGFAQATTFKVIQGDPHLLRVFKKMAGNAPAIYRNWKTYADLVSQMKAVRMTDRSDLIDVVE